MTSAKDIDPATVLQALADFDGLDGAAGCLREFLRADFSRLDGTQIERIGKWLSLPDEPDGIVAAVTLCEELGQVQWALELLSACEANFPTRIEVVSRIGLNHARAGNWCLAVPFFARAAAGGAQNSICVANLGAALFLSGNDQDAIRVLQRGWEHEDGSDCIGRNLFHVAVSMNEIAIARRLVSAALSREPKAPPKTELESAGGLVNLFDVPLAIWSRVAAASLATQDGETDEAIGHCTALLTLAPEFGHSGLGVVRMSEGKFEDAVAHFKMAIKTAAQPTALYHLNCSKALTALGRDVEAGSELDFCLALNRDFSLGRFHRTEMLLRQGRYKDAWPDYELRRVLALQSAFSDFDPEAEWHGEMPLTGMTVVVVGEQGQGDTIQFARFTRAIAEMGAEIYIFCQRSLVKLLESMGGIKGVFTTGDPIPAHDYWVPLMSLPLLLDVTLENIPAQVPYVFANEELKSAWAKRLHARSGRRIGIVWSGNSFQGQTHASTFKLRNLTLKEFCPLIATNGTSFFSLQKGEARQQLEDLPQELVVFDYSDEWADFADTAAFMMSMDLIITVDTAVAHLAGALGLQTWILSRYQGCWRWLYDRTDSPWYPTATVFHQHQSESWADVIQRVSRALTGE